MNNRDALESFARQIRRDVVMLTQNSDSKGGHLGGALSVAEILAVLYGSVMNINPSNPEMEERDRFILSKAHAAIAMYSALKQVGFVSDKQIQEAFQIGSPLKKHPKRNIQLGIESSGGSLGMGLSFGMGIGLGLKKKGNDKSRVFVLLGDGECDEGSVWEAASAVVHYKLNNVYPIIDANNLQIDGNVSDVMNLGDIHERWRGVGFDIIDIDGHDVMDLQRELSIRRDKPTVYYCRTVKGKGVSFAENNAEWHVNRMSQEQYELAVEEIG